jgi:hypothetical protein
MHIVIRNPKLLGDVIDIQTLKTIMTKEFKDKSVVVNITTPSSNVMKLTPVKEDRLWVSAVKNKITMGEGDARVKKLGRNFLESERLTKKQFDSVQRVFDTMSTIGVTFDMGFVEYEEDLGSELPIYQEGRKVGSLPAPKSFTEEMV